LTVFVAATSRCFPELPLEAALHRLVDLEYSHVELMIHETNGHMKPSEILADPERALMACRQTHRMTVAALSVDMDMTDEGLYYRQFAAICKLAKASKVVTLTVRSSELGTPFNAEIERLRALVAIATNDSVRVGLLTESGRMTQDPDTAGVFCDNVKGLGISLDPSHYVFGPQAGANYEPLMKHVYHVRLRDTNKSSLQVRVGQGEVEYGRLVNQLTKFRYDRALCVDIIPQPDVDQMAEMRKMRLLLESLL
jgi:sugar phosphate isomerase/epimerase